MMSPWRKTDCSPWPCKWSSFTCVPLQLRLARKNVQAIRLPGACCSGATSSAQIWKCSREIERATSWSTSRSKSPRWKARPTCSGGNAVHATPSSGGALCTTQRCSRGTSCKLTPSAKTHSSSKRARTRAEPPLVEARAASSGGSVTLGCCGTGCCAAAVRGGYACGGTAVCGCTKAVLSSSGVGAGKGWRLEAKTTRRGCSACAGTAAPNLGGLTGLSDCTRCPPGFCTTIGGGGLAGRGGPAVKASDGRSGGPAPGGCIGAATWPGAGAGAGGEGDGTAMGLSWAPRHAARGGGTAPPGACSGAGGPAPPARAEPSWIARKVRTISVKPGRRSSCMTVQPRASSATARAADGCQPARASASDSATRTSPLMWLARY
mmetsp:Transcript_90919/g.252973  ORF Transcript_90919/g.252973 Transcript_90919/m.252973 type:complete len:378 (+) Transcript_90919:1462-2595(+)